MKSLLPLIDGVFYYMEIEIWKDIPGYEGYYQASNLGRIKSLDRITYRKDGRIANLKGKELFLSKGELGYYQTSLFKNKKAHWVYVHQLIAITFLNHTPCRYKLVVDHINNIKTDNKVKNLQITDIRHNSSKDRLNKHSKYTGVSLIIKTKRWKSTIDINKKSFHLGSFKTEEEARDAYQNAISNYKTNGVLPEKKVLNKTSKYIGVSYIKKRNKWEAYTHIKSKKKNLGYYKTEKEAHEAYLAFYTKILHQTK